MLILLFFSLDLFVYMFIYLVGVSCQFIYLFVNSLMHLSIYLFIYLFVWMCFVCLFFNCIYLFMYSSVCLFLIVIIHSVISIFTQSVIDLFTCSFELSIFAYIYLFTNVCCELIYWYFIDLGYILRNYGGLRKHENTQHALCWQEDKRTSIQ